MNALLSPGFIALLSGFAVYFTWVGFARKREAEAGMTALQVRLKAFEQQVRESGLSDFGDAAAGSKKPSFVRRFGVQLSATMFAGVGGRSLLDAIDRKLVLGGRPHNWTATDFVAWFVLGVGGAAIFGALMSSAGLPPVMYLALVALVAYYFVYDLNIAVKRRKEQAFFELPGFLDDLILAMSGGTTSLNDALKSIVTREDGPGRNDHDRVLVREFRVAYQQTATQARSFREAFEDAAERLQVQHVTEMVESIIETQSKGAPLLPVLRQMRTHVSAIFETEMQALIQSKEKYFSIAQVVVMVGVAIIIATPLIITVMSQLGGLGGGGGGL